jgi:hypothetical protein
MSFGGAGFTGYINDADRPLTDLAAHILLTALSRTLNAEYLKGLEWFVSNTHKHYCYQLVNEWQRSSGRDELYEICRHVEC